MHLEWSDRLLFQICAAIIFDY